MTQAPKHLTGRAVYFWHLLLNEDINTKDAFYPDWLSRLLEALEGLIASAGIEDERAVKLIDLFRIAAPCCNLDESATGRILNHAGAL